MKRLLYIIILVFVSNNCSLAQERPRLIHADIGYGIAKDDGRQIRKMEGNVQFAQGKTNIRCDMAEWDLTAHIIRSRGNVILSDGDKTLFTEEIEYYEGRDVFILPVKFKLTENNKVITAEKGTYRHKEGILNARERVHYHENKQHMYCDDLTYNQNEKSGMALGNVRFVDLEENVRINGSKADFLGDTKYLYMPNRPVANMIDETANDTAVIRSDVFEVKGDSSVYIAKGNVDFSKGLMKAKSGLMQYFKTDSVIELSDNPKAWQENSTLYGDIIRMYLTERKIRILEIYGNARAVTPADTTNKNPEENVLKGKHIVMDITDNVIDKITSTKNAESIFYRFTDGRSDGANYTSGEIITLYFKNGNIHEIIVNHQNKGKYFPPGLIYLAKNESASKPETRKNESSEGRKPVKEIRKKGRSR